MATSSTDSTHPETSDAGSEPVQVGRFTVLSTFGTDATGLVFRARDEQERAVAIMVMPRRYADDADFVERFRREVTAMSALEHPTVVAIRDVGDYQGCPYVAMDDVRGKTLREHIDDGRLSLREIRAIAIKLADGLASAHAAGVVRREFMPEHIGVTDEGDVKLFDPGLATLMPWIGDDYPTGDVPLSVKSLAQSAAVAGTASYVAPEQARGETVDFRADQFVFGAILYELLSGHAPFKRDTADDTMAAIAQARPTPIRERVRELPDEFADIVERCLIRDAAGRYERTEELVEALRSIDPTSLPDAFVRSGDDRGYQLWIVIAFIIALIVAAVALVLTDR